MPFQTPSVSKATVEKFGKLARGYNISETFSPECINNKQLREKGERFKKDLLLQAECNYVTPRFCEKRHVYDLLFVGLHAYFINSLVLRRHVTAKTFFLTHRQ